MKSELSDEVLGRSLPGRVVQRGRRDADTVALRHKQLGIWGEISWADYAGHCAAAARAFHDMGVRPGDHVAVLSDNRPQWLYADLGAQALGARSVGLYQTSPAADVAYILNHSKTTVLVCENQEQVDKWINIGGECPSVKRVLVIEPRGTHHYEDDRLTSWDDAMAKAHAQLDDAPSWLDPHLEAIDPDAASMVVYTSGTTGTPKGAMISSRGVLELLPGVVEMVGTDDGTQLVLSYLPLCHVAEKIYTVFLPLGTNSIVHFGESIDTVQDDLREVSPTIFLGVPRIWEKMHASLLIRMQNSSWLKRTLFDFFTGRGRDYAQARKAGTLSLGQRLVLLLGDMLVFRALQERLGMRRCTFPNSGAAPIAPELLQWFHGVGIDIREAYGMTELGGASHLNSPGHEKLGTVGRPIPGLEQRLGDDGELLLRGACVFVGYLHNEEATRGTIDEEGFLHTGDLASIDDEGYVTITGRKKEIIITAGGKNLSPEKIENALKTSPYIKEVVTIGDQRKFIGALVQIEYDTVGKWAQDREMPYTSFADLSSKPEVLKLVDSEIKRCNDALARVEQVRGFKLLPRELNEDDGEVTATQKVRRRVVLEVFEELVEEVYGGGKPAPKGAAS